MMKNIGNSLKTMRKQLGDIKNMIQTLSQLKPTLLKSFLLRPILIRTGLLFCFLLPAMNIQAELRVTMTPNPATTDDILVLTLSLDTADNFSVPEATKPLGTNFSVLSGPTQQRSTQIINGKRTGQLEWTYQVQPKQVGTFEVPAFKTKSRNKIFISQPFQVTIRKPKLSTRAQRDQWAFVEAEVDRSEVYLQEQITLDLRLYTRAEVEGNVEFPDLEKSFIMHNVEDQKQLYKTKRNGHTYRVNQFRILLFPKTLDISEIPPIRLVGKAVIRRGSFFDPGTVKPVSAGSKAIALKVLEPKQAWLNMGPWLPAKDLTITETWDPDIGVALQEGEPITRKISIEAWGQIADHIPPFPDQNINGVKLYPDQLDTSDTHDGQKGSIAKRIETAVYIPNKSGSIHLPSIEIPWFNTTSRQMEVFKLPKHLLNVKGNGVNNKPLSNTNNALPPSSVREPTTSKPDDAFSALESSQTHSIGWIASTFLFFILWLITAVSYYSFRFRQKNSEQTKTPASPVNETNLHYKKHLKALIQQIKKSPVEPNTWTPAILTWASSLHQTDFRSLESFINEIPEGPLKIHLSILNQMLYSQDSQNMKKSMPAKAFVEKLIAHQADFEQSNKGKMKQKPGVRLSPLYPQENISLR